jgi:hypothetical protein
MSRILYIDCFAGAAGDMLLGALLDLGVPLDAVLTEVRKLGEARVGVRTEREARHGISGVRVHVEVDGQAVLEGEGIRAHEEKSGHLHVPVHGQEHEHVHAHGPEHVPHGRRYLDIDAQLARAGLAKRTEDLARRAFRRLAEAEARVHGVPIDAVHFHEVGALDALVDVVGVCAAVAALAPDEVVASPVPLGRGMTESAHGRVPLPAPATVLLLAGVPVYGLQDEGETVTPTGAALIAALADRFGPLPPMRIEAAGYGVGARDPASRPNLLRLVWGIGEADAALERLWVLEANVDDMNPEIFEYLTEALFAGGARDVWITPVQMKKGRPAAVLSVLCDAPRRDDLVRVVLRESTTLGVRFQEVLRRVLAREVREVETPWGAVRVKVARDGAEIVNIAPEYEDCKRLARAASLPLKRVYQAAVQAFESEGAR